MISSRPRSSRPRTRWAGPLAVGLLALAAPTGGGPAGVVTVPVTPAFVPVPAASPVREDFDGDGYADLVVADRQATVDGRHGAGRVTVFYGGPDGLSPGGAGRRAVISRATGGVPGAPVAGEGFGARLSRGDLDADGYADLVVGTAGAGGAVLVRGGPHGLAGAASVPAATAQTGDFDGDGLLDLALFRPGPGTGRDEGAAGTGESVAGTEAVVWTGPVRRTGVPARVTVLDPDGLAHAGVVGSASGDLDGDGRDDLVLSARCDAGAFCTYVYRSTASGPVRTALHRGGPAVAVRDLDGDGYADVVAGDVSGSAPGAGRRVAIAYGSPGGVGEETPWKPVTPKGPGASDERLGTGALPLDTDGDGCADLAAAEPGERTGEDVLRRLPGCLTAAVPDGVHGR